VVEDGAASLEVLLMMLAALAPVCEVRNRKNTEVYIVFMHRKSGKILRF
jgi:hypothetical protein